MLADHRRPALAIVLSSACLVDDDESDRLRQIDAQLDAADVGLAEALAVPDPRLRDARLVAGELETSLAVWEAELWDGDTLLYAIVGLDGALLDIDALGDFEAAAADADVLERASITPYDAIAIAEESVDDSRAIRFLVDDEWLHVDVIAPSDIYGVWIDPSDGGVVKVALESPYAHQPYCTYVCW